jgi:hypothetical protein
MYPINLSSDGSLMLYSDIQAEAFVMPLPDDARRKLLELLGLPGSPRPDSPP